MALYDRPRYIFDESNLFSHSHEKKDESKKFPWWKPVWSADSGWGLVNKDGKKFDIDTFLQSDEDMFPDMLANLKKSRNYEMFSLFFVEWMKKIVYYRSVSLFNKLEKRFTEEFPKKRPDQIVRMVEEEVAKYFTNLK